MYTRKTIVAMIILLLISMNVGAWGATVNWYVDPDGNDLSDGNSWSEAFATIKKAVDSCTDDNNDVIDVNTGEYVTGPIIIDDNDIDIRFGEGVTVAAKSNDPNDPCAPYFSNSWRVDPNYGGSYADVLFRVIECSDIIFDGNETTFLMQKDEYDQEEDPGEWRHVIHVQSCRNVRISGLTLKDSGGDGLCISHKYETNGSAEPSERIEVNDVTCDNNWRTGIAITCANDVTIENCILKNTSGAPLGPWAGIDFEPGTGNSRLNNIVMRDTVIENNAGHGIQIQLGALRWQDKNWQNPNNIEDWEYTDITIEDCFISGGPGGIISSGPYLPTYPNDPNGWGRDGTITITNVTVENTTDYGLYVSKSSERGELTFNNCVWANVASLGQSWPLEVRGYTNYHKPGGINFNDCQVFDWFDRPTIKLVDKTEWCPKVYEIHGDIYVKNDKRIPADANDPNDPNCLFDWSDTTPINVDVNVVPGLVDSNDVLNRTTFEWYSSIQAAINDASSGDVIEIAPCTHYESIDFDGKAITVRCLDPNDANVVAATIIDATGYDYGVYFHSANDINSTLRGFTVTGASRHGIYCYSASPTIEQCVITGNGGFSYNGGGMYNDHSDPNVLKCTFSNNDGDDGGGMGNYYGQPIVCDCNFTGNTGDGDGGGMWNYYSSPTVTGCDFSENIADNRDGGGIYSDESSPIILDCVFYANEADEVGGGIYSVDCTVILDDCVFAQNTASDHGGGITNRRILSASKITSCVFWANSADDGGGISNRDSDHDIINCTFFDNDADEDGGAIYNDDSDPDIVNCIFWQNTAGGSGDDIYNAGTSDPYEDDNFDDDPEFYNVNNPDGNDGIWGTCDDGLNLDSTSDCIDEGDSDAEEDYDDKDIKGSDRELDSDPDIGAYEYDSGC